MGMGMGMAVLGPGRLGLGRGRRGSREERLFQFQGPATTGKKEFRCVRFDRQRHEGAGKEDDARRLEEERALEQ